MPEKKLRLFVPNGAPAVEPKVITRPLATYPLEPTDWLWTGWLARGKLHMLAGEGGVGKSTLALDFAATISRGGDWPDDTQAPRGDVLVWSGEDGVGDTLKARVLAANGDPARIHIVHAVDDAKGERPFVPAKDLDRLGDAIEALTNLKLLILDPVSAAYVGDSHKDSEVRQSLAPLIALAERHHFSVLGIAHFAKGTMGRNPTERVMGSVAVVNAPRLVMVAAKPAETGQPRILARTKSNIGPDGGGFSYQLLQVLAHEGAIAVPAQRIDWGQALEGSALELLAIEQPGERDKTEAARAFLDDLLANGPVLMRDIQSAAKANGHAWRTVERAKGELGAKSTRTKGDQPAKWSWELPERPAGQDRHD